MKLFLSHARKDSDAARLLARRLRRQGFGVWLSEEEIEPGENWAKKTGNQFFDADTQTMVDRRDEGLPPRFHKDSSLTAEVSADNTKFDFDLKSQ